MKYLRSPKDQGQSVNLMEIQVNHEIKMTLANFFSS